MTLPVEAHQLLATQRLCVDPDPRICHLHDQNWNFLASIGHDSFLASRVEDVRPESAPEVRTMRTLRSLSLNANVTLIETEEGQCLKSVCGPPKLRSRRQYDETGGRLERASRSHETAQGLMIGHVSRSQK
jgi:hypothetical protein